MQWLFILITVILELYLLHCLLLISVSRQYELPVPCFPVNVINIHTRYNKYR